MSISACSKSLKTLSASPQPSTVSCYNYENSEKSNIIPAPLFTDFAVLQRDVVVPVWGFAQSALDGKELIVTFCNQSKSTIVQDGKWRIELDPMPADKIGKNLIISCGGEKIKYADIKVGEVWFASGQSNMCFYIEYLQGITKENIKNDCNYPEISIFVTPEKLTASPQRTIDKTKWIVTSPFSIDSSKFSTVGFLFARQLYNELDVPIGIVVCAFGGTRIETWIPSSILSKSHINLADGVPKESAYNAMLKPLIPYAFKGLIWYQGEGNAMPLEYNQYYSDYVRLMVDNFRTEFNNPSMPFFQVQLPSYNLPDADYTNIRFKQQECDNQIENCFTTINYDTGDPNDIHPSDKLPIGERLASMALDIVYGIPHEIAYPTCLCAKKSNSDVILTFDENGSDLIIKNPAINALEICGEDGIYHQATAQINFKNQLIVYSDSVKNPKTVRYAHRSNVLPCQLFGTNSLPAKPFIIDVK